MPVDEHGEPFVWLNMNMHKDPAIRKLKAEEYGRLFREAMDGKQNIFSKYISWAPNPNLD